MATGRDFVRLLKRKKEHFWQFKTLDPSKFFFAYPSFVETWFDFNEKYVH